MRVKRCPFCGDTPTVQFHKRNTESQAVLVACENELCDVQPCASGATEAIATQKWNRRAL